MNKAAQAYFQTNVNTTDQGQLLLLLYDGALKFLQQAREKMLEKDYAAKGILISKVIDILNELTNTLNLEKGGSLAENLNNLYFLCTTRLLQANLKMNVEQLDNVASILSGLRSAYAEIIETPEARRASAQIASKLNVDASVGQRAAVQTQHTTMPTAMGKMQARNAYGAMQRSAPAPVPAAEQKTKAPASGIAAVMAAQQAPTKAAALAFSPAAEEAPAKTEAQAAPVASVVEATSVPVEPSTTTPATSGASTATKPVASPAGGFGVKGLAYAKAFGKQG